MSQILIICCTKHFEIQYPTFQDTTQHSQALKQQCSKLWARQCLLSTDEITSVGSKEDSYPDDDREQRPAARGQVDVRVQQVLVQVGVWQQRQLGQHSGHLQVDIVGLEDREGITYNTAQAVMEIRVTQKHPDVSVCEELLQINNTTCRVSEPFNDRLINSYSATFLDLNSSTQQDTVSCQKVHFSSESLLVIFTIPV